ncbi:MAG: NAD(P)-dependent oxidoreductase, partial [Gammaproteobacteria bacterium]
MNKEHIGFIGLGLMGVPMTQRLLEAGYFVSVWNRNPVKMEALVAKGAHACTDIAELTKSSDILMLCISNTDAVEAVVFGEKGIATFASSKQLLVDFSSISPEATVDFATRLQEQSGCQWIDAPVSGGVAGAESGSLVVMAGGDKSVVDSLGEVLGHLAQRVTHMGPVGSGQATKVCNQMLVSCNVMVM